MVLCGGGALQWWCFTCVVLRGGGALPVWCFVVVVLHLYGAWWCFAVVVLHGFIVVDVLRGLLASVCGCLSMVVHDFVVSSYFFKID